MQCALRELVHVHDVYAYEPSGYAKNSMFIAYDDKGLASCRTLTCTVRGLAPCRMSSCTACGPYTFAAIEFLHAC